MWGSQALVSRETGAIPHGLQDPACRSIVAELIDELTDLILRTERFPDQIPRFGSQREVLARGLLPTEERDPRGESRPEW